MMTFPGSDRREAEGPNPGMMHRALLCVYVKRGTVGNACETYTTGCVTDENPYDPSQLIVGGCNVRLSE